ncbi:MAG: hypothetical protein EON58_20580, partial [Alphaproteobacteria bacterium]
YDPGQRFRDDLIAAVAEHISSGDAVSEDEASSRRTELLELVKDTRLKDIVEYGRSVHAEMDTLMSCSRNRVDTNLASLYVTTFPCHNCARHIVASGIRRVVYLEPYRKSKALELHADAIHCIALRSEGMSLASGEVSHYREEKGKVRFEPLVGVSPRRYNDFFSLRTSEGAEIKRKDKSGKLIKHKRLSAYDLFNEGIEGEVDEKVRRLRIPAKNEGLFVREWKAMRFLFPKMVERNSESSEAKTNKAEDILDESASAQE